MANIAYRYLYSNCSNKTCYYEYKIKRSSSTHVLLAWAKPLVAMVKHICFGNREIVQVLKDDHIYIKNVRTANDV